MRRICALAITVAVLSVPFAAARAGHCASAIVVFSRTAAQRDAGLGAINPNVAFCAAAPGTESPYDTRLLVPGAVEISIRYTRDLGSSVPALAAVVNGLGFANHTVSLSRYVDSTTYLASYSSSFVRIPQGEAATGSVRVTVTHPMIASDSTCFHTWNASC